MNDIEWMIKRKCEISRKLWGFISAMPQPLSHLPPPLGFLLPGGLEPQCLSLTQILLTQMPNGLTEKSDWPYTGFITFNPGNSGGILLPSLGPGISTSDLPHQKKAGVSPALRKRGGMFLGSYLDLGSLSESQSVSRAGHHKKLGCTSEGGHWINSEAPLLIFLQVPSSFIANHGENSDLTGHQ